ncbi:MAG: hypothetical protein WC924_03135 [Candidatus Gracilibacteria bacterium]
MKSGIIITLGNKEEAVAMWNFFMFAGSIGPNKERQLQKSGTSTKRAFHSSSGKKRRDLITPPFTARGSFWKKKKSFTTLRAKKHILSAGILDVKGATTRQFVRNAVGRKNFRPTGIVIQKFLDSPCRFSCMRPWRFVKFVYEYCH